jgi:tRNA(His) guanylyltransferase
MKETYDSLGDRMKRYEDVTRAYLMPRSYTMLRIDGACFSQYTKDLIKPFDEGLIKDLNETWLYVCENVQNAKVGYAQSDEFSLLLTDFEELNTEPYFGGNIQKICSVVASMAAAKFNSLRPGRLAFFDCRAFTLPNKLEVFNCFYWRWKDCERNSTSSVAHANFSHKELQGKSRADMHEMLMAKKGINWSKLPEHLKNGRFFLKEETTYKNPFHATFAASGAPEFVTRKKWAMKAAAKLSKPQTEVEEAQADVFCAENNYIGRDELEKLIP